MFNLNEFMERNTLNVFLFVLVLGVSARIISFIILPEATYTDSVFHLSLVKEMLETGSISTIQTSLPMPFYHFLVFVFFAITGLPLTMPFVRIIPFAVSFFQILLAYLIGKQLFPKNKSLQIFITAFVAAHATLSIFSTVNFTGPIAAMFVLSAFFFLVRIMNSKKVQYVDLMLLILSIFALSLSKFNATFTLPAFIVGLFYILKEKKVSFSKNIGILAIILLLSSSWFMFNFFTIGTPLGFSSQEMDSISLDLFNTRITPERASFFYFNFWNFPGFLEFPKLGIFDPNLILLSSLIFFVAMLPLVLLIFNGFYNAFTQKNKIYIVLCLAILLVFPIVVKRGFESRLFIPVIPLFGIIMAYSFSLLKNNSFKAVVVISFILFGLFSFAYVSGSAYYFNSKHEKVSDFYLYISELPENSKILSLSEHRKIMFYAGKQSHFIDLMDQFTDKTQFISAAHQKEFSHFAVSCNDEYNLNENLLKILVDDNTLELIYHDECSSVYHINYGVTTG